MGKYQIYQETDPLAWIGPDDHLRDEIQPLCHELMFDIRTGEFHMATIRMGFAESEDYLCGFVRGYSICLKTDAVALTMAVNSGEFDHLLDKIRSGVGLGYDSILGLVALLSDEGEAAEQAFMKAIQSPAYCLPHPYSGLWNVVDWFDEIEVNAIDRYEITGRTSDWDLFQMAEEIEDDARKFGVVLYNTQEHLASLRDELESLM